MKATMIDAKDNVAVVLGAVAAGEIVEWTAEVRPCTITAKERVPMYHKIAVADIACGAPVVKYGEHIGIAATDIAAGSHVHAHNVKNNREVL